VLYPKCAIEIAVAMEVLHHIAWHPRRDRKRNRLARWQNSSSVTPVQDRQYFNSIYFREPGGVLLPRIAAPPGDW
jgi:glyoxalase family protein